MHVEPTAGELTIYGWLMLAIFAEGASSFALQVWLRRHGMKLVFGLTATPGYVERAYYEWCKNHQRSATGVLLARAALFTNVVAAAIFAIPILAR